MPAWRLRGSLLSSAPSRAPQTRAQCDVKQEVADCNLHAGSLALHRKRDGGARLVRAHLRKHSLTFVVRSPQQPHGANVPALRCIFRSRREHPARNSGILEKRVDIHRAAAQQFHLVNAILVQRQSRLDFPGKRSIRHTQLCRLLQPDRRNARPEHCLRTLRVVGGVRVSGCNLVKHSQSVFQNVADLTEALGIVRNVIGKLKSAPLPKVKVASKPLRKLHELSSALPLALEALQVCLAHECTSANHVVRERLCMQQHLAQQLTRHGIMAMAHEYLGLRHPNLAHGDRLKHLCGPRVDTHDDALLRKDKLGASFLPTGLCATWLCRSVAVVRILACLRNQLQLLATLPHLLT
eukprot:Opistho-2@82884